jgi:hypothetical protein
MHPAEPVERTERPQVGDVIVAPGEVEQPEPVADGERVEVQRVPLAWVRIVPGLVCHRLDLISRIVHGRDPGQHNATRAVTPVTPAARDGMSGRK